MNGSKLAYFVIATLLTVLFGLAGAWAGSLSERVLRLEQQYAEIIRTLGRIEGRLP